MYDIISENEEYTVVAEYAAEYQKMEQPQTEAQLEKELIETLVGQGYEYLPLHEEKELVENLRRQLEQLNQYQFSDSEWERFFREVLANQNNGIVEKTAMVQVDYVQVLKCDDGKSRNITLIDHRQPHNNRLQVINQYEAPNGQHEARYDVTILVNGLPLVHLELKKRGVQLKEAFNQIDRYQRESFWSGCGLYEYVQIFIISNGTNTKYYSNSTRWNHIREHAPGAKNKKKTSNSFEFTSFWADGNNRVINDLRDFARTFLTRHTLLYVLTRYCVFTSERMLMVMRPYQIAATERIINRIRLSQNYKRYGSVESGGYIWHTTGSGKTLTSFKTAQLASRMEGIGKVLFVVDRKDLDYQTMKEYDRFEKDCANGNSSTAVLKRQLEREDCRIIVTTIQKLSRFVQQNRQHPIYQEQVVVIFDECHRSHFGEMHTQIVKHFKKYYLFGFTGTPIFAANAGAGGALQLKTTQQAFGDKLHTYTIVDAIHDQNVLPFRIDYINTMKHKEGIEDKQVQAIDRERALQDPKRIANVVEYMLKHFDQKTCRNESYVLKNKRLMGFNAMMAVASIPMAKLYYQEFKRQQALLPEAQRLKVATIFSYAPNEEEIEGVLGEENPEETTALDQQSREFLDGAIQDYNAMFNTNFDSSGERFQNYYKDLSLRMKNREVDLLIVVNMFLTGFDATTMNTLFVDKNLKQHGLIQAFSRTNRILNSVKKFGNIVCFRDLQQETDDAIALFGDKDASSIVVLRDFGSYYNGFDDEEGKHHPGYKELIAKLQEQFPLGEPIVGEQAEKEFIRLFGSLLRCINVLSAFDQFEGKELLTAGEMQDYQSHYLDLRDKWRPKHLEKEVINDDLVFEMELIRQVEINIDYILMLVRKYHESNCQDKEILVSISKAIGSSDLLRSKKELIESFVASVNADTQVEEDWATYVQKRKEEELTQLIAEESLKEENTRQFVDNAFRDGAIRTSGTDIDKILPPMSRFGGGGGRMEKKTRVIDKLKTYFERYFGLVS